MSSMKALPPPLDGSYKVFPGFLDFHAEHNPDHPYAIWPDSNSPTGVRSMSYAQYAEATHRVAHILRPDREGGFDGEIIPIVVHTDSLLYCALIEGCIRAGFIPFPMSQRNSGPAICNMMEKTSSHRIIADPSLEALITEVRAELASKNHPVEVIDMPDCFDVFPFLAQPPRVVQPFKPYPSPTREAALDDIVVYLHSSGSTGFPKPIPLRHIILLNHSRSPSISGSRDREIQWFSGQLPTFHAFGFIWQNLMALVVARPVGHFAPMYPAPPVVPNPENTLEASMITGCDAMAGVPAFVESWARSEEASEYLKSLKCLIFAGGPLSKKCGDELVARGVKLASIYAGTEFGLPTEAFYPDKPSPEDERTVEDWEWIKVGRRFKPRWEPQGDGSYELQLLHCDTHVPSFNNLPDVPGYATSDLFVPHPTKKDLWRVTGRTDDVIVLGSAEKIVPLPQEGHILSSAMVKGAVMFGRGREEAGVLIEPSPQYEIDPTDEAALVAFRNKIWPVVDEANRLAPAFARIFKEMILVTDPKKPLPRAAKGTTIRKQVLQAYDFEINRLYETVENSTNVRETRPPSSWDIPDIESWLLETAISVNDNVPLIPTVDLFQQGYDSLSATFLRTRIVAALRMTNHTEEARTVPQNFIFDHPTISRLALATHRIIYPNSSEAAVQDPVQPTRDMIAKYTADMPERSLTRSTAKDEAVVLLTGSTGNLGSHILAALLENDRVAKVFTMDRASSSGPTNRVAAAFAERGLSLELLKHRKLVPLTGDFNLVNFGFEQDVYDELKNSVTDVIHNAWALHFSHHLPFFEPLISGTRKLVDFALTRDRPVRVLFTSSVSAARGWDAADGFVPEEFLADTGVTADNGYAASKYVVERMFETAGNHGLDAICLRVGQMCGSEANGSWNTTDWVPSLVKSSLALGAFPDAPGPVNWIAVDTVAKLVLDLIFSKEEPAAVLNVVHPRPSSWYDTIADINSALGTELPCIPFGDWTEKLEERSAEANQKTIDELPAIKLLNFFNEIASRSKTLAGQKLPVDCLGLAMFATTKLQYYSPTVRDLMPLNKNYAKMWIKYWREKEYL